jgi:hypothetical protein
MAIEAGIVAADGCDQNPQAEGVATPRIIRGKARNSQCDPTRRNGLGSGGRESLLVLLTRVSGPLLDTESQTMTPDPFFPAFLTPETSE